MLIGIISGSGTYSWPGIDDAEVRTIHTAFGPVESVAGRIGDIDVMHVSRHGQSHFRLSNHVDHRANLAALIDANVDAVIGCTVCGAVDATVPLGATVVFDDLYFPSNRLPDGTLCTWHQDPGGKGRGHWIFDRPFSEALRASLVRAGSELDREVVSTGTYGHVDGPRFNSRAEIAGLAAIGVSAVSQTAGPEVVLAGEAGVPYALIGFVTDYANGVSSQPEPVERLLERVTQSTMTFATLIAASLPLLSAGALQPVGIFHRVDQ